MLQTTARADAESQKVRIEPQLVLEIQGISTLYGAVEILKLVKIGDSGLTIGSGWKIGGTITADDQEDIISFDSGTTTQIDQQLYPDKGSVSSVSSMVVALLDKNEIATKLISPGLTDGITDILGAKATVWLGLKNTAFKEDFVPLFFGVIDDIVSSAGIVQLNIASPEQTKRQKLFTPISVEIVGNLDNSQTTITLVDASQLPNYTTGPDGSVDASIDFYIQVENEFIRYNAISGNSLTGCTRGAFRSDAVSHTAGSDPLTAKSAIQISDSCMNIALKTMLSGLGDFYLKDLPAATFVNPDPLNTIANSIFFRNTDLNRDYGVTEEDYITITGATNGANNCSAKKILQMVVLDSGTYLVIDSVSFVPEEPTAAIASIRSRFDVWSIGLAMTPDMVDVNEHVFWNDFLLSTISYRFVLKEDQDGKEWLDKQIYVPVGAYSIPRKGRCSMGYHVGPIIRGGLKVLDKQTIKNPDKIKLRRTSNRNFYNTIAYEFDKNELDDKFKEGIIEFDQDSRNKIKNFGDKVFLVSSDGLRKNIDGIQVAKRISERYLKRYRFAAEFFEAIDVFFKGGFNFEPGDQILFDPTDLQITDTKKGDRKKSTKVFDVTNKKFNIKTGAITLALTDTNFDGSERFGVISPSSLVVSGTTTEVIIKDSFGIKFPGNESKKWVNYIGLPIIVHSYDWSFAETVTFRSIDPNNRYKLLLDPTTPLSVPPLADYIVDIGHYTHDRSGDLYKAAHAYLGASVQIATGIDSTHFTVNSGDVSKFSVNSILRVHTYDYSADSGEVKIKSIVGTTIETETTMGFTPDNTFIAEMMNFADGGKTYRYI